MHYALHYTLYSIHYTLYILHSILYIICYTLCIKQFTLHIFKFKILCKYIISSGRFLLPVRQKEKKIVKLQKKIRKLGIVGKIVLDQVMSVEISEVQLL